MTKNFEFFRGRLYSMDIYFVRATMLQCKGIFLQVTMLRYKEYIISLQYSVGLDRPKMLKQVVTAPLPKARQQARASRFLGDDHYKRLACVTVGFANSRTLTAQWP